MRPPETGGATDINTIGPAEEGEISGSDVKSINLMLRYHLKMMFAINSYFKKKKANGRYK